MTKTCFCIIKNRKNCSFLSVARATRKNGPRPQPASTFGPLAHFCARVCHRRILAIRSIGRPSARIGGRKLAALTAPLAPVLFLSRARSSRAYGSRPLGFRSAAGKPAPASFPCRGASPFPFPFSFCPLHARERRTSGAPAAPLLPWN